MIYILLIWFLPEYPSKGLMRLQIFIRLYINIFLGQEVGHVLNGILSKFRQNFKCQNIFLGLGYMIGRVSSCFSNGLECQMPCRPLNEFRETGTHSRVRGGCHVSTFSGQGMTNIVIVWDLINDLPVYVRYLNIIQGSSRPSCYVFQTVKSTSA